MSIVCVLATFSSCGHTHIYKESVISPTCQTQGYTLHKCTCGAEYKDNYVDATHSYQVTIIQPTCTDPGYTSHVCEKCGKEYKDNITEALGHTYKQTTVNPTCTKIGYTLYTCEKCGDKYTENTIGALGHTYKQTTISPTCTNNGYTLHTCEKCGKEYKDNETVALGHSYIINITKPATTISAGEKTFTCSICGNTYIETIPKLETDWEIKEVVDSFGDKTGTVILEGTFKATYRYDSSTTEHSCTITADVGLYNNELYFMFWKVYVGSSFYSFFDDGNGSLKTKTINGAKKTYDLHGGSIIQYPSRNLPGDDEFINDIKTNQQLMCVVYSGSKYYTFTMNNTDFTNILNTYLEIRYGI